MPISPYAPFPVPLFGLHPITTRSHSTYGSYRMARWYISIWAYGRGCPLSGCRARNTFPLQLPHCTYYYHTFYRVYYLHRVSIISNF